MTSSTLLPPSTATAAAVGPPRAGPVVTSTDVASGLFDGLAWTYCHGAEHLLAATPAAVWAHPEAQGWRRVKHNQRREVWRAAIGGQAYYLKYYFVSPWRGFVGRLLGRDACQDEWEGGLFAGRLGIPAVRPVARAQSIRRPGRRCTLLVTEAVEPAESLEEFWPRLQTDDHVARRRRDTAQIIELLAEMIARAHQAGFEHRDMHVANILVQPVAPRRYRTLFVDLHSARRGLPISDRAVVRNLAQLNQWFGKHSTIGDRLRFVRAYLRWRDEYEHVFEHGRPLGRSFAELVAALGVAAQRHARRLGAQRDRRVRRDGRYFTRLRLPGGWRGMAITRCKHPTVESRASSLLFDRQWWQQQLHNPLRWFEPPVAATQATAGRPAAGTSCCKDSHSVTVCRALLEHHGGSLPVIIKRPRARNWRRWFVQLWAPSRSMRGWRIGHALLHRDVPTARPLAVLERRFGPLLLDNLLVTEAIPGALDLETLLRKEYAQHSPIGWFRLKSELNRLLVGHVRRLQERGFEHRDCKASNILVLRHPCTRLLWIDMDGLRHARRFSGKRRWWALVRLHVSLLGVPGLTRTDRVRFLKGYCARFGLPSDAWRRLWRSLQPAIHSKIAARQARRRWKLRHYGRE